MKTTVCLDPQVEPVTLHHDVRTLFCAFFSDLEELYSFSSQYICLKVKACILGNKLDAACRFSIGHWHNMHSHYRNSQDSSKLALPCSAARIVWGPESYLYVTVYV